MDQIIIELIGDPSGLKPAEDALKKLSKVSDENIASFRKANEAYVKYRSSAADKQVDIARQLAAREIEIARQASDAIFANAQQRRANELKATEDNLKARMNAELLNTTLTASQRNAIERKYRAEEAEAKLQSWKADQKAKEEQAIINGLLAFTTSLAQQGYPGGLVTGLLALAQAGVQAGIIASRQPPRFAKGVIGIDGPGTATSDSIPAYLSRGESVMTADETRRFRPVLEAMRKGDFMERYIPKVNLNPLLEGTGATLPHHAIDYDKLSEAISRKIPAPVINSIQLNEKGFIKHITKNGNRMEYVNNEIKF